MLISSPCPLSHVLAYHNEQTLNFSARIFIISRLLVLTDGATATKAFDLSAY